LIDSWNKASSPRKKNNNKYQKPRYQRVVTFVTADVVAQFRVKPGQTLRDLFVQTVKPTDGFENNIPGQWWLLFPCRKTTRGARIQQDVQMEMLSLRRRDRTQCSRKSLRQWYIIFT
jgi:hypothetical protein